MDRYAARLLLTAVLLGAAAVSATLFSDAMTQAAGSEPQPVSVRREIQHSTSQTVQQDAYFVSVCTQPQQETNYVTVLDADGAAVGSWQTSQDGNTAVGPLVPGDYYAKGSYTGYAKFTVAENAAVSVQAGCGWADGEQLHLTDFEPARVELTCTRQKEGLVTLTLMQAEAPAAERTGYVTDGKLMLTFDGLRPGSYDIFCGSELLSAVKADGQLALTLALPEP